MKQQWTDAVIGWFRENRRPLPWREGKDPYHVWLSEVMLQQTRIEAVIPYYFRFLDALPTIADLAACPEETLLKLWEGLGYYSRVRHLKRAAQIIMQEYGGVMPRCAKDLRALPGIGEYTAGAIASIAFGEPEPAVDGNVLRVFARLFGITDNVLLDTTKKRVTRELSALYPAGDEAGALTEGLMELGERICIPGGSPLCAQCPLEQQCVAYRDNTTDSIPLRVKDTERKKEMMTVFVLRCGNRFAIRKRPARGLLAGMWEFYHISGHRTKQDAPTVLQEVGVTAKTIEPLGTKTHLFTHIEWQMTAYLVTCLEESSTLIWKTKEEIDAHCALPTAFAGFWNKAKEKA